eukprot:sb/3463575/
MSEHYIIKYAERRGKELEKILSELSCEFATSAWLKLSDAPKLTIKAPAGSTKSDDVSLGTTLVLAPNDGDIAIEIQKQEYNPTPYDREDWEIHRDAALAEQMGRFAPLRGVMPQATFGHGRQTMCDTGVRDALQLPADKFEVMVKLSENGESLTLEDALADSGVLTKVQKNLGIDAERFDLVAEQYSLNMYGKGGHFKKHKDTPRGSDMIGTLLVQLPGAYYEGGALEIFAGVGSKKMKVLDGYKLGKKWQLPDPTKLRVAAFFCDIDHEVLKVLEGLRLTVAFILRVENIASEVPSSSLNRVELPCLTPSAQETALTAKFVEFCNDESFLPETFDPPTFLAFPCFHLYTNEQVFPNHEDTAEVPLTETQVAQLKGKDSIIGKAVLAAAEQTGGCVEIYLQPMVGHEYSSVDDGGNGDYLTPQFPKHCKRRRMDDEDIASHFNSIGHFDEAFDPIWVIDLELGHKPGDAGDTMWSATGYYGNEAGDVNFYVKSFLRVEFAPYEERKEMIQGNKENYVSKRKLDISATSQPKKIQICQPGRYEPTRYSVNRGCSP